METRRPIDDHAQRVVRVAAGGVWRRREYSLRRRTGKGREIREHVPCAGPALVARAPRRLHTTLAGVCYCAVAVAFYFVSKNRRYRHLHMLRDKNYRVLKSRIYVSPYMAYSLCGLFICIGILVPQQYIVPTPIYMAFSLLQLPHGIATTT